MGTEGGGEDAEDVIEGLLGGERRCRKAVGPGR